MIEVKNTLSLDEILLIRSCIEYSNFNLTPELKAVVRKLSRIVANPYKPLPNETIFEWVDRMGIRAEYGVIIEAINSRIDGETLLGYTEEFNLDSYFDEETVLVIRPIFSGYGEYSRKLEDEILYAWIDFCGEKNNSVSNIISISPKFRK